MQNRLRDITIFADISTAANRWITTNYMWSGLVSQVLEYSDAEDGDIDDSDEKSESDSEIWFILLICRLF